MTPGARGREWVSRYALALIVVAGAAVRFGTLGSQGFWFDEHLTIVVITQKLSGMFERILNAEANPPLYFLVAGAWERVFGVGEVGLRSLSALCGTATIGVVYAAGRALGSRRAGLLAAALTATSPLMIWYSQEARPYALFVLCSALAFLFFVKALQGRGLRWLLAWTIASILTCSTHYFGFGLTAVEATWLIWAMRGSRAEVALSIGAVGAAAAALLPLAAAQRHYGDWIPFIDSKDRLLQVPQHFVAGLEVPWAVLAPLAVAAVAAVTAYAIVRADRSTRRMAALPGGVAIAGAALAVVALLAGSDYLITRNLIALWVPFALALAVLLAAPALNRLGLASVALLCVLGLALAVWTAATPTAKRPDWGPLVAALGPPSKPRAIEYRATFLSSFLIPLVHYLPGAREPAPGERVGVQELDVIARRRVPNHSVGPCWWLAFCGGRNVIGETGRLPVRVPRGFKLTDRGRTSLFRYRRYSSPRPVVLPPPPFEGVIVQAP